MIETKSSQTAGYIFAAILVAIGGALLFAIATKAIPKMMSNMMSHCDDGNIESSRF